MSEKQPFTREFGIRFRQHKLGRLHFILPEPIYRYENPDIRLRNDRLTGLKNRQAFEEDFEAAYRRASRSNSIGRLALLLLDINGMKRLNDTDSHESGDRLLRTVGRCLGDHLRTPFDERYRFSDGGDEFAALLPDFNPNAGSELEVAERIEGALKQDILDAGFPADLHLGATVVIGTLLPDETKLAFHTRLDLDLSERKRQLNASLRGEGILFKDSRVIDLRSVPIDTSDI